MSEELNYNEQTSFWLSKFLR